MALNNDQRPDGLITEKLYSPLFVQILADADRDGYGDMDTLPQSELRYHEYEIHEAILDNRLPGEDARGLMAYYHGPEDVEAKVHSLFIDVEKHGGRLWGVATIKTDGPLEDGQLEALKDYISGQYSDGFGEGFEQREIRVDAGDLYVSLWTSGDEFFIDTAKQFIERTGIDVPIPPEPVSAAPSRDLTDHAMSRGTCPPVLDEKPSVIGRIRRTQDEARADPAPHRASPGKDHEPGL
jgi:hypothetical protein